jgi:hypothetical protein
MTDINELAREMREDLEGVTPGPWIQSGVRVNISENCIMVGPDGFLIYAIPWGRHPKDHAGAFRDAAHLRRCSPDNIRAILDDRDRLIAENERLKAERDEARATISAFEACHGIGRPQDGYRELIWRDAAAHYEEIAADEARAAKAQRDSLAAKLAEAEQERAELRLIMDYDLGDPATFDKVNGYIRRAEAAEASLARMREALTAVQSEILLTGQLAEVVDAATQGGGDAPKAEGGGDCPICGLEKGYSCRCMEGLPNA